MTIQQQIKELIEQQPEAKRSDMEKLHACILAISPKCKQWYESGVDSTGKVVTNPNIGYGAYTIHYADGTTREFFRIGMSSTKTGISIYVLGLKDKTFLKTTYASRIGKASITGYCIRFKALKDINLDVLEEAIRFGFEQG